MQHKAILEFDLEDEVDGKNYRAFLNTSHYLGVINKTVAMLSEKKKGETILASDVATFISNTLTGKKEGK